MNLKQISHLLFSLTVAVVCLSSCNDSDTTTTYSESSADAQIYSFALTAAPYTAADTVNYEVLGNTKFVIDQFKQIIYNPDSLPYQINVKKFAAALTYSSASPSAISLTLRGVSNADSVVSWNTTDSIDFSILKSIEVTPQNGDATLNRKYIIDLRIHKVDPDTILWVQKPSLSNGATSQKTILKDNQFYCYSLKGSTLSLDVFDKSLDTWSSMTLISPPPSIILESLILFNDKFYAVNTSGSSFKSDNGLTWTDLGNHDISTILGILPAQNSSDDQLLVIVNEDPNYIAKTKDLVSFEKVSEISETDIESQFPANGFSSITNYNRTNTSLNQLILTGGKDFSNTLSNLTWLLRIDDNNNLQKIPTQQNTAFDATAGIETFLYDESLYALTGNQFYISSNWGITWTAASSKQRLDSRMPVTSGQSVIIDSDNYIWIFGNVSASPIQVWRGRLNKLNPKI